MTDFFPASYSASRATFCEAARRAGFQVESHPLPGDVTGPGGEPLSVDVAIRAADCPAAPCLLLSSGLHGIEGFFGAAVQHSLLESWTAHPPPSSLRCVLVHALNPFGFAWLRRTNEDNVDLNRSFFSASGERPSNTGYAALDGLLNPRRPPSRWEPFVLKALLAILRAGDREAVKQAVAGGQYDFPKGLFYGGCGPSAAQGILEQHLQHWTGGSQRVVHLDFHTGLGRSGTWKLLVDYHPDSRQLATLESFFGRDNIQLSSPGKPGIAYQTSGSLGAWCVSRSAPAEYVYACAEFGTCSDLQVLSALRAENQAHHWDRPGSTATLHARRRLMERFCPASSAWRKRVLKEGQRLVATAVKGLANA